MNFRRFFRKFRLFSSLTPSNSTLCCREIFSRCDIHFRIHWCNLKCYSSRISRKNLKNRKMNFHNETSFCVFGESIANSRINPSLTLYMSSAQKFTQVTKKSCFKKKIFGFKIEKAEIQFSANLSKNSREIQT